MFLMPLSSFFYGIFIGRNNGRKKSFLDSSFVDPYNPFTSQSITKVLYCCELGNLSFTYLEEGIEQISCLRSMATRGTELIMIPEAKEELNQFLSILNLNMDRLAKPREEYRGRYRRARRRSFDRKQSVSEWCEQEPEILGNYKTYCDRLHELLRALPVLEIPNYAEGSSEQRRVFGLVQDLYSKNKNHTNREGGRQTGQKIVTTALFAATEQPVLILTRDKSFYLTLAGYVRVASEINSRDSRQIVLPSCPITVYGTTLKTEDGKIAPGPPSIIMPAMTVPETRVAITPLSSMCAFSEGLYSN